MIIITFSIVTVDAIVATLKHNVTHYIRFLLHLIAIGIPVHLVYIFANMIVLQSFKDTFTSIVIPSFCTKLMLLSFTQTLYLFLAFLLSPHDLLQMMITFRMYFF